MKIGVYQRHIDRGFGGKGSELICPLAVAMSEQLGVKIGIWDGKAFNVHTAHSIELPEEVVNIYLRYDKTGMMKPFEFEVDVAPLLIKEIKAQAVGA